MEHSEHYSQYLHAFSCAMLGQGASVFSPDGDAKPYLAVALGVVAARRDSDFLNLEEFCEAMATNLRITPKVDAAPTARTTATSSWPIACAGRPTTTSTSTRERPP
jgi:hypothetical protein